MMLWVELADGNHRGLQRIDVAGDDRLQLIDDLGAHQHTVDRLVRLCGVPAAPLDVDIDAVGGRHHRPGPEGELADGKAGVIVHPVHFLDAEALHHTILDHLATAAAALLGRLEDHDRGSGKVARLGEVARGAQEHRGVAIMAAGVHLAGHGDLYGRSFASMIGSASMSARSPITCEPPPLPPRITPTTPVLPMPVTTSSQPKALSFSATQAAVRWTSNRSSG
jgi:hypothetical protein